MEDNFRNALIILSAIVIAAIFIHGFWTIRKNKNPYKLKAKNEKVDIANRGFDGSGFDQDGVSKARVVGAKGLNDNEIPDEPAPAPSFDAEPLPKDIEKPSAKQPSLEPNLGDLSDIHETVPAFDAPPQEQSSEIAPEKITVNPESEQTVTEVAIKADAEEEITAIQQPVYQQPVEKPKVVRKKSVRKAVTDKLKRNQMEINFGDEIATVADDEVMPSISAKETVEAPEKPSIDPEVIIVSVVMPDNGVISGAALLPTLLTLGLRFGDMDIFHRHQDSAGNGKVTFSLANMMNPGTFDLDQIETFTTQGISLFMTLPNANNPFEVFEQLMSAAKQLSMEFGAQLLDDKRSVMTKQTEQHYMGKIRDFERRNRIASA
jgi:cell division protein ZipA